MFGRFGITCLLLALCCGPPGGSLAADQPLLQPGDSLALVGGTLVERMRSEPWLDAYLQLRRPDWRLRVRNLGWSGDDVHGYARKLFDGESRAGLQRLLDDLELADSSVVLIAYGFAAASNDEAAVQQLEPGLTRLVEALEQRQRRVILMTPFELPGVRSAGYRERMQAAVAAVQRVGDGHHLPVVSVTCQSFTDDALVPDEQGYRDVARQLADALVGRSDDHSLRIESALGSEPLAELILRKEELFFHRHRPQNETYLRLFRKHEQGNNLAELSRFDPLIEALESRIWQLAGQLADESH